MAFTTLSAKSFVSVSVNPYHARPALLVRNSAKPSSSAGVSRKFAIKSEELSVSVRSGVEIAKEDVASKAEAAKAVAGCAFLYLASEGNAMAAQELALLADADNRPLLLLFILLPALGWVLFNILKPALNQVNKMRGMNSAVGAAGLSAVGSLLLAQNADAAQEIVELAADNRPFLLLLILGPAVGWVLFNILKPALNQINKMRGVKSLIGPLGLGTAGSLLLAQNADAAQEVAELAADNRPLLLLVVLGPAVGWVLFNILKPALNQVNKMRGIKSVAGPLCLGAGGSLLLAQNVEAAQEVAELAADNRPLLLLVVLGPAVGWVLFNILQPAIRQLQNQIEKNSKKK